MTTVAATKTAEQEPRHRLDDALRRYLDSWTIGQERELGDGVLRGLSGGCRRAAIALGYLEVVGSKTVTQKYGNNQSFKTTSHTVRRTEKQPLARTFRPPKPESLWPWSLAQHWHVIQGSPCQARRTMFTEMVSDRCYDRWARYKEIDDEFPEIRSEGGLKHLRGQFAHIIRHGAYDVYDLRRNWYGSGPLSTPPGLARMLATMMVRPVIQGGRITRFAPLDPRDQLAEIARFPRKGLDQMLIEAHENSPPSATTKE